MIPFLHLFRLKNSHLVFRSLQVKGLLPIVNQLPLNYGWLDDCCIGAVNRFMSKYKPKGFWIFCGFSFLLCMLLGLKTEMLNLDSFQRLYILLVIEMLRSFFFLSKMVLKLMCLIFDYITVKTKWCLHKKYKNLQTKRLNRVFCLLMHVSYGVSYFCLLWEYEQPRLNWLPLPALVPYNLVWIEWSNMIFITKKGVMLQRRMNRER